MPPVPRKAKKTETPLVENWWETGTTKPNSEPQETKLQLTVYLTEFWKVQCSVINLQLISTKHQPEGQELSIHLTVKSTDHLRDRLIKMVAIETKMEIETCDRKSEFRGWIDELQCNPDTIQLTIQFTPLPESKVSNVTHANCRCTVVDSPSVGDVTVGCEKSGVSKVE